MKGKKQSPVTIRKNIILREGEAGCEFICDNIQNRRWASTMRKIRRYSRPIELRLHRV